MHTASVFDMHVVGYYPILINGASLDIIPQDIRLDMDKLNKYFTISGMPVASSRYWNSIHGTAKGEAEKDEEGKQTMRTLARNMSFLIKSIALGKEKYGLPEKENTVMTNFIR